MASLDYTFHRCWNHCGTTVLVIYNPFLLSNIFVPLGSRFVHLSGFFDSVSFSLTPQDFPNSVDLTLVRPFCFPAHTTYACYITNTNILFILTASYSRLSHSHYQYIHLCQQLLISRGRWPNKTWSTEILPGRDLGI